MARERIGESRGQPERAKLEQGCFRRGEDSSEKRGHDVFDCERSRTHPPVAGKGMEGVRTLLRHLGNYVHAAWTCHGGSMTSFLLI